MTGAEIGQNIVDFFTVLKQNPEGQLIIALIVYVLLTAVLSWGNK